MVYPVGQKSCLSLRDTRRADTGVWKPAVSKAKQDNEDKGYKKAWYSIYNY